MTPVNELTYNQAIDELQNIVEQMQDPKCDVDNLTALTRRAAELIAECRRRLTAADNDVRTILNTLTPQ